MRSRTCRTLGAGVIAVALATSLTGAVSARPSGGAPSQSAGPAAAIPSAAKSCYSNLDSDAVVAITSQNFEAAWDSYDVVLADDVTIGKKRCTVTSITVIGEYYNGIGPADSETVTFYKDKGDAPGKVYDSQTVVGDDNGLGSFDIPLKKVKLKKKTTYWVSVQANMDYTPNGEWGWVTTSTQTGEPAMYENPGDGFGTGCTEWAEMQECASSFAPGPDVMFELVKK